MGSAKNLTLAILAGGLAAGAAHAAAPSQGVPGPGQPALSVPWPDLPAPPVALPPVFRPAAAVPRTAAVPAPANPAPTIPATTIPAPPSTAAPLPAAQTIPAPTVTAAARPIEIPVAAMRGIAPPVPTEAPPRATAPVPLAVPEIAIPPALRITMPRPVPVAPVPPPVPPESHPGEGIASHALLSAPVLSPAAVEAEAGRLRSALRRDVPGIVTPDPARSRSLLSLAEAEWHTKATEPLDHPQLVVVVDRNPRMQVVAVVLARPEGGWEVLGLTHVSTGQPGRFDHYITPTGVFFNSADILGYRAEGTYNENHIRGYGVKGMRVWDFGWQVARKGWKADGESGPMRLEMHATDPEVLAQRIGSPASQGCVRIPAALNVFFDRFGVIDAEYERAAADDIRYRALLLPNRTPTPLAGHALVVVDSSGTA